jgi:microsomal dipeptidase-like Zn-dependent dipeptidase
MIEPSGPFADIHQHSSLKAFYSGYPNPTRNIWDYMEHNLHHKGSTAKFSLKNSDEVAKYSQTNFYDLIKGNVRVPTVSLYPMETGFLDFRNVAEFVTSKQGRDIMAEIITGYGTDAIKHLRTNDDYYSLLYKEYRYVYDNQGKSPCGNFEYSLATDYKHLRGILNKGANTIAVVLSVEGAHVFFDKEMLGGKLSKAEMRTKLIHNIAEVKQWEVPPFSINLCHHFYNGLCGHSRSFSGLLSLGLLNQNRGMDLGFTGMGIIAARELVSRQNGKRIVIDTKHMSLKGRQHYYNWIRSYNRISSSDKIPIICSHTGVNGYKTMSASIQKKDNHKKMTKHHFNRWSINISDEEIKIIHETGGLIGIMMDKYKMAGNGFFEHLKTLKDRQQIKDAYAEAFMDNVIQMVQSVGKPSAWDMISLGTDYDGAIPHVDCYDKTSKLPEFYDQLVNYLDKTKHGKEFWYGLKPQQIANKIFGENALGFYERHFV